MNTTDTATTTKRPAVREHRGFRIVPSFTSKHGTGRTCMSVQGWTVRHATLHTARITSGNAVETWFSSIVDAVAAIDRAYADAFDPERGAALVKDCWRPRVELLARWWPDAPNPPAALAAANARAEREFGEGEARKRREREAERFASEAPAIVSAARRSLEALAERLRSDARPGDADHVSKRDAAAIVEGIVADLRRALGASDTTVDTTTSPEGQQ